MHVPVFLFLVSLLLAGLSPASQVPRAPGAPAPSSLAVAPDTGAWMAGDGLGQARADHVAIVLGGPVCRPEAPSPLCGAVLVGGGAIPGEGAAATVSAEIWRSADERWSPTGPMTTARARHAAVLLDDGRVLVAGGGTATAETFQPEAASTIDGATFPGAWAATGPMAVARSGHTATSLPGGRVLVAGGGTSTAEIYDPAAGTWSTAGAMKASRTGHTATALPGGQVLVAGGGTVTAEIYDPAAGTWSVKGPMAQARTGHTATSLPGGRVLVAGGGTATAEIYDPVAGAWSAAAAMAQARTGHTASALADGRILVVGGGVTAPSVFDSLDTDLGGWSAVRSPAVLRSDHRAAVVSRGRVLVSGGRTGHPSTPDASTEMFDPFAPIQPPVVSTLSPPGGSVFGGTRVTISGIGLAAATKVELGGAPVPFEADSTSPDSRLIVTTPAHPLGPVSVIVTTPDGRSNAGLDSTFSFVDGSWVYGRPSPVQSTETTAVVLARAPCGSVCGRGLVLQAGNIQTNLYDADFDEWTRGANTTQVHREGASSTLLADGKVLLAGGRTLAGTGSPTAEVFDPTATSRLQTTGLDVPGSWTASGPMVTGRAHHTATLLADGRVLVAGGLTANAEIFDPVARTWAPTGTMTSARTRHTATALPGGRVLVVGGYDASGSALSTAEVYDPGNGTWSTVAGLAAGRAGHSATRLVDGTVLVAGGCCSAGFLLASAERFDPELGSWTLAGSMPAGREKHGAVLLGDGSVMVVGGCCDASGSSLAGGALYRPTPSGGAVAGWSPAPLLQSRRQSHAIAVLGDGRVLAVGGVQRDRGGAAPEPSTELLTTLAVLPPPTVTGVEPRVGPARGGITVTITGRNFVASPISEIHFGNALATNLKVVSSTSATATTPPSAKGTVRVTVSNPVGGSSFSVAGQFTYAEGEWEDTGRLGAARYHHTATALDGPHCRAPSSPPSWCEEILVAGGSKQFFGPTYSSAELYEAGSGRWKPTSPMAQARFMHTATLLDGPSCRSGSPAGWCGKVLVVGGQLFESSAQPPATRALATAELYDPESASWSTAAPMAHVRLSHTATLLDGPACHSAAPPRHCGQVLVVGGTANERDRFPLDSAELYDPATGRWSDVGSLDNACASCGRSSHTATVLPDDRVLVTGGLGTDPQGESVNGVSLVHGATAGGTVARDIVHVAGPSPQGPRIGVFGSADAPDGSTVAPGTEITYRWAYFNDGTAASLGAVLSVGLPEEVDFRSASGGVSLDGRTVRFAPVDVPPGSDRLAPAETASVTVVVRDRKGSDPARLIPPESTIVSGANISASGGGSQASHGVEHTFARPARPVLAVSAVPPSGAAVGVGDEITYRLAWFNSGVEPARDLVVSDRLPTHVDFVASSEGGSYDPQTRTVTFLPVTVGTGTTVDQPSGSATITARVRETHDNAPTQHGVAITNNGAEISGLAANPVVHYTAMPAGPASQPRVATSADPPAGTPVAPGDVVTYRVAYFNSGTSQAEGVVIVDELPEDLDLVAAPDGATMGPGRLLTFPAVSVAPGTTADEPSGIFTVKLSLRPLAPKMNRSPLRNTPGIRDGDVGNPVVHPLVPRLRVVSSSIPPPGHRLKVGDRVTYTISWYNDGTEALHGVVVSGSVDAKTKVVSVSEGGVVDSALGRVSFPPVTVPAGTSSSAPAGTVSITVQVVSTLAKILDSAVVYDPTNRSWTSTQPMASPRFAHTATAFPDGTVLVAGGFDALPAEGIANATSEIYDPGVGKWGVRRILRMARGGHTATLLAGGSVLVAGSALPFPPEDPAGTFDAEVWDPIRQVWQLTQPMVTARGSHSATLLEPRRCREGPSPPGWCGSVLVAGGFVEPAPVGTDDDGDSSPATAGTELYVSSPAITQLGPASGPPEGGTALTIRGFGFAGATTVRFGSNPMVDFSVVSPTEIRVTAPPNPPGRVEVRVESRAGTSAILPSDPAHQFHYGAPGAIADLTARALSDNTVELRFSAPATAGHASLPVGRYVVKQSFKPIDGDGFAAAFTLCGDECRFEPLAAGEPITVLIGDLEPGTTYHYMVQPQIDGAIAPFSNPASATTTGSAAPTPLSGQATGKTATPSAGGGPAPVPTPGRSSPSAGSVGGDGRPLARTGIAVVAMVLLGILLLCVGLFLRASSSSRSNAPP